MVRQRTSPERVHGDIQGTRTRAFDAVFRLVRRIPRGKVMTYGQIATWIENRLSARAVGWALHGCPEDVPWQRVVNAQGGCSTDRIPDVPTGLQRSLLECEGVEFRENGALALERYRWTPRARPVRLAASTIEHLSKPIRVRKVAKKKTKPARKVATTSTKGVKKTGRKRTGASRP